MDFDQPTNVVEQEDEATLAAIDRGINAADEGRLVSLDEVEQWMKIWLSRR